MKVPEPRNFKGKRDSKELENFLFDMEQYFRAIQLESEDKKVSTAAIYLTGDAKIWWRTRYDDVQAGRMKIDTWDDLKRELKAQFIPENVGFMARRKLRRLQHTGDIQEYVRQFAAIMLDIKSMSEDDKLYQFYDGLKPWAMYELQRRRVTDLK